MTWGKREDMVVHEQTPYNAEPPRSALAGSTLTPTDTFYSRNHGPVPELDEHTWRLRVDGLVRRELDLTLGDLRDGFEPHTLSATLQCAGNRRRGLLAVRDIPGEAPWGSGAVSTAEWTGVRLADVLAQAGVEDGAAHVAFWAPDLSRDTDPPEGYGSSVPLAKASAPEVLLAWAMNGDALEPIHGAPLRAVVPGYIGARSVKWLDRVSVQREPSASYFQATAYRLLPPDGRPAPGVGVELSSVALTSDFWAPDDGDRVDAGPVRVCGYAFAGDDREVTRVDVSPDGGTSWVQASTDGAATAWTWRPWHTVLHLDPGEHRLLVRAWDSTGTTQPESAATLWNPKGYVNNSWASVTVTATA